MIRARFRRWSIVARAIPVLLLFSCAALAADTEGPRFSLAVGAAWAIPTSRGPIASYHGLRQDIALTLLGQWHYGRFVVQGEISHGGFSAGDPEFTSYALRIGALPFQGAADVYVTGGIGYLGYRAKSQEECFAPFFCDPLLGNGLALVAEAGTLLPYPAGWRGRPSLFVQLIAPRFTVEQHDYGFTSARAVPVVLLGFRLMLATND